MKSTVRELIEDLQRNNDMDDVILVDIWYKEDIKNHFFDVEDDEEETNPMDEIEKDFLSDKILQQMDDEYDPNDGFSYSAAQAAYRAIISENKKC